MSDLKPFTFKAPRQLLRRMRTHVHLLSVEQGVELTPSEFLRQLVQKHLDSRSPSGLVG